jgi:hypothetical protein
MLRRAATASLGIGLCLALAGVAATAWAAPSNLIKNGGFEKPVVGGGSFQLFATGSSFSHWKVVGAAGNVGVVSGTFSQNGFTFPSKSGAQWLDLTGTTQTATGVAQTVATEAHTPYTISFAVENVVDPHGIFGTASTVDVLVDGNLVSSATNRKGTGSTSAVWKVFSVNFIAAGAHTTIAFVNGDPSNDTNNGLDAVRLSLAP